MSVAVHESGIDRLAPTQRPSTRVVMWQQWRHLLFLHWMVPVELLRSLVPEPLCIDTYQGQAYVGLIAFTMKGVHPCWAPTMPGLSSFHETNVRTYVHLEGKDPGVWFFSLDASHPLAVLIARTLWKLPYFWARMKLEKVSRNELAYSSVRWGQKQAFSLLRCRVFGRPTQAAPGSLDHFLLERYVLYTMRERRLYRGRIHHAPYPMQPAELLEMQEGLVAAARIVRPEVAPIVHYAGGVNVEIFPLRCLA